MVLGWTHCGRTLLQSPRALVSLRSSRPPLLMELEVESGWQQRRMIRWRHQEQMWEPPSLWRREQELLTLCQNQRRRGRQHRWTKRRTPRCCRAWSVAVCDHQAPRQRHRLWRKWTRSRRLNVKNHDLKPSASSTSEVMKLWSWKRRTPLGR